MQIVRKVTFSENNAQVLAKIVLIFVLIAIVSTLFAQPVAAENTYRITDGDTSIVHTTSATDPERILSEAGVLLGEADMVVVERTVGGTTELRVRRLQMVTVNCDGNRRFVGTYGETVAQLLDSLQITLGAEDRADIALDAATFDGMTVEVIRVTHETVTGDVVLPHETVRYAVSGKSAADPVYLSVGQDGMARRTVRITYENGVEVSRSTVREDIINEPVREVVVGGALEGADGTARVLSCLGTAYSCDGRPGITATGTVVHIGTVAVDPRVIKLGSAMYIASDDGVYDYGFCTAEDTGGLIKGNRVDLYMDTTPDCFQFGARRCTVYVLN